MVFRENGLFFKHVKIIFGLWASLLYCFLSIFMLEWTESEMKPIFLIKSSSIAELSLSTEVPCFQPCLILMNSKLGQNASN